MINPINGLEMANQSGIASRKGSESRLRRRHGQQGAIRKIRTSDNHRWPQPTRDVRRAKHRVSVAEVECKSGSHPSPSEECLFSSPRNVGRDRSAAISRTQDFPIPLWG